MFDEKSFFLKEILEEDRVLQIKTSGFSMFPIIKYNDLITIKALKDSKPQIGDVILFKIDEKYILHRIIKKFQDKEYIYITKGDAALYCDEPVKENQIIGKAIKIKRNGKTVNLDSKIYKIFNYILSKLSFLRICRFYWILSSIK